MPAPMREQPGRRELDLPAAGEKLASTGRQRVLDPVRVRTVGQRNDEAATGTREDIDRSPVCLAGAASAVDYDTNPGSQGNSDLVTLFSATLLTWRNPRGIGMT